ncbi:MAG: hypothetical protein ACFFDX_09915, partial [Candidatus Odinarchaeota archaeon]
IYLFHLNIFPLYYIELDLLRKYMNESKDSDEFDWEDLITKKKSPQEFMIREFIVYKKVEQNSNEYVIKKFEKTKEQNLEILNLIKDILENVANLTPKQIIDYCKSQRYFMKLYFKQIQEESEK